MPYTPVSCGTGHSSRGTRTMPYIPVSCESGHSFRGTRTMPYAYWGSECQSERAPAWRENASWSCVLDWTGRERVNEEIRGRPKADQMAPWNQVELWNCAWEAEMKRWEDKTGKTVIKYPELRHESCQFSRKELFDSGTLSWGDCHFVREFLNFKPAINKNSQRLNRNCEKQREFIIIWRRTAKNTGFRSEQDHYFTMNRDLFSWSDESNVLTMSSSERTVLCYFSEWCPWKTIQFRCSCLAVGFIVVCSE